MSIAGQFANFVVNISGFYISEKKKKKKKNIIIIIIIFKMTKLILLDSLPQEKIALRK